ncbi:MAG: chorismate synthase, partial [Coriobacteriaceae bacterium]|nr:chorismate synthase [Coriobacteriaceae bacterium]
QSACYCPDPKTTQAMKDEVDAARKNGYSLGGEFTVIVTGLVEGLGSYASGPERLTSKLGAALFSIPAMKGVEFGMGFRAASLPGNKVHDPIAYDDARGYYRTSNNAGGLEGGMTTGAPLIATVSMKPIPTMMAPLATVDTDTHETVAASKERSDTCAVPAASVVAEAEVAFVLADAYLDKFGHDCVRDILAARDAYLARLS